MEARSVNPPRRGESRLVRICRQLAEDQRGILFVETMRDFVEAEIRAGIIEDHEDPMDLMDVEFLSVHPILHQFIQFGDVRCLRVCLDTCDRLDFTRTDFMGKTAMMALCEAFIPDSVACEMLALIVHRLASHPQDKVDWLQRDYTKCDFIDSTVMHHRLHLFWRIVQDVPAYADTVEGIPISPPVLAVDWEMLSEADRNRFLVKKTVLTWDQSLWRLCFDFFNPMPYRSSSPTPYVNAVLEERAAWAAYCVRHGAQLTPPAPTGLFPLHVLLETGNVECLRACLRACTRPINFHLTDCTSKTALECLCSCEAPVEVMRALLQAVVERWERMREIDTLNWWDVGRNGGHCARQKGLVLAPPPSVSSRAAEKSAAEGDVTCCTAVQTEGMNARAPVFSAWERKEMMRRLMIGQRRGSSAFRTTSSSRSEPEDFLTLAAQHHHLSTFWPLLKELAPFKVLKTMPLPLRYVSEEDWKALQFEDFQYFLLPEVNKKNKKMRKGVE